MGGLYVVHTLNLWGPIMRVSGAMYAQAGEVVKERLREFLESTKAPSLREPSPEGVELRDFKRPAEKKVEGEEDW